jgi:regulator of sirC expression with transglutaminase-like and TPR domain
MGLTAREQLQAELDKSDAELDLAVAALAIAQEEYPHLDSTAYLDKLDQMGQELATRLPDNRYPLKVIQALNHYLFSELNFQGKPAGLLRPPQ